MYISDLSSAPHQQKSNHKSTFAQKEKREDADAAGLGGFLRPGHVHPGHAVQAAGHAVPRPVPFVHRAVHLLLQQHVHSHLERLLQTRVSRFDVIQTQFVKHSGNATIIIRKLGFQREGARGPFSSHQGNWHPTNFYIDRLFLGGGPSKGDA